MSGARMLVCGGRDYADQARVDAQLDLSLRVFENALVLIHGAALGADQLAANWAARRNVRTQVYAANWKDLGRAAGAIRNQQMLDEGKPDFVVAFPGGRGTADMVRRAREAGVPVQVVAP